jgi:pentose-5-phosphate-3-epimerase
MRKVEIALSILEYGPVIKSHVPLIKELASAGLGWVHIDSMREPFISGKSVFPDCYFGHLLDMLGSVANLDFHLMDASPEEPFSVLERITKQEDRHRIQVTVHREAYRDWVSRPYDNKEYDLSSVSTGNPLLDAELRAADKACSRQVLSLLRDIKMSGFRAGLALEPRTSFADLPDDLGSFADAILLMGVSSGSDGQRYMPEVTEKIRAVRSIHKCIRIQVDGCVNEKTIPEIVAAGADNLVIGSYITGAREPLERLRQVRQYLDTLDASG